MRKTMSFRPTRPLPKRQRFRLLTNHRRNNRRHVYLVIGDVEPGRVLAHFKATFDLTGTLVNVTPRTPAKRLQLAVADHGCCIFYVQSNSVNCMRDLRALVLQHGYAYELLTLVNKVYQINDFNYNYALAA